MTEMLNKEFSRKSFVKGGGALVVGFSLAGAATAGKAGAAFPAPSPAGYNPSLTQLDSWLRINADNTAAVLTSQGEVGQGIATGFLMVAAEELDMDLGQMIYGTSTRTKDGKTLSATNDSHVVALTGGIGGSQSMISTGHRIRAAAVAARAELLKLASAKLGVPVGNLTVEKGVVSGGSGKVTYGELIGGKSFNLTLTTTSLNHGVAPAKPVSAYKLVGTRAPRVDVPAMMSGQTTYVHNIKLPGMLHGRIVRPGQGPWGTDGFTKIASVDESSVKHLPNVQVVRINDFLGVVAPTEYVAVQAAAQLKVKWVENPILPGHANYWAAMRKADTAGQMPARINENIGNFDAAFAAAPIKLTGTFKFPYQSHTPIGPAAAVADYRALGGPDKDQVTVFSNTQNIASTVTSLQQTLKLTNPSQVRSIFYQGSSTFGNGYHYTDINDSAAILSRAAGKPVRLQLMRRDEQGWNKYGPAMMFDMRAGIDASGNILAYEAVGFLQASAGASAAKNLLGDPMADAGAASVVAENNTEFYKVANRRLIAKTQTKEFGSFQVGTLRAPGKPQANFATEQMIDMMAEAAKMDPLSFRLQNIRTGPPGLAGEYTRFTDALSAAVKASPYKAHVPASQLGSGNVVTGWGMAIGTHRDSYAGTLAHVEVNKKTGKVRVLHIWSGQDSGFAINPGLLENQMSGNLIQGVSKTLHEEVTFSRKRVTSSDWVNYPILRFKDAPPVTTVVLNRPDRLPSGSGEPPLVPTPAAIANALYDATGVRMTQAPFTPARVRGFLRAAGK